MLIITRADDINTPEKVRDVINTVLSVDNEASLVLALKLLLSETYADEPVCFICRSVRYYTCLG